MADEDRAAFNELLTSLPLQDFAGDADVVLNALRANPDVVLKALGGERVVCSYTAEGYAAICKMDDDGVEYGPGRFYGFPRKG